MPSKKTPTGNPKGRPKTPPKRSVGRPKGEAGIMKEYRARMLNSPKSTKVLEAIFDAALDDEHKNQATAWTLIMNRIAPISSFEKDAGSGQRTALKIEIKDVGGVTLSPGPQDPEEPREVIEALETTYEVTDHQGE